MKKEKKTVTFNGSNQLKDALNRGIKVTPRKVVLTPINTHEATKVDRIEIDWFARDLMEETFPIWMPKSLQNKLIESLRGFSEDAALWIAESLIDCYNGQSLETTGIRHIDDMLWSLYPEILNCAREMGIRIANHY